MAAPSGWEPVERVPTYELVLRRIEEQLISRTLRPGDRDERASRIVTAVSLLLRGKRPRR